ncbi:MAG: hypothetical protein IBX44_03610 [Sulfurospirillum sp.]|nr:hypothetical protein [Sulfurospirillum sp.]
MLNLKILSTRDEINSGNKSVCYLCEGSLEEYVKSIPERYTEYDIQRGIVKNVYLDRLTKSILANKYIPPIVLIADKFDINGEILKIKVYKILDGLQRTYRIKAIYYALNLFISEIDNNHSKKKELKEITKYKLSKMYKTQLDEMNSDITILWSILRIFYDENKSLADLKTVFANFNQWFEVWVSLDQKEQINKMLVLNAGHKPMDIKHQLELLFLNIIHPKYLDNFVRSKDANSSFFYKRKQSGELHLSHFISAIISFHYHEPISVDAKFIRDLQDDLDEKLEELKDYFLNETLELFIEFMKQLDIIFFNEYGQTGIEWIGKETMLIGIFAALGKYYKQQDNNLTDFLNDIKQKITINITNLKINEFEDVKNTIDFTKLNIGDTFKNTTFYVFCHLFFKNTTDIDWQDLFKNKAKRSSYDCE